MRCPLCRVRKPKRSCPGIGEQICTVCCGTKRLVEIACPPTCIYLETAQRHPAALVKRQQERDVAVLMGALGALSEPQLQLFFAIHTFIARLKLPALVIADEDVAAACGALAGTFETASRGVLYEQQAPSPGGEALRRELKALLAKIGGEAGSPFEREAAIVLRGIERGARHDAPGIGSGAVDYLALVARILQERPPAAGHAASRIILP
jgi:hypothetical protein